MENREGIRIIEFEVIRVLKGDPSIKRFSMIADERLGCVQAYWLNESGVYLCRQQIIEDGQSTELPAGTYYTSEIKLSADIAVLGQRNMHYARELSAILSGVDQQVKVVAIRDLCTETIETADSVLVSMAVEDLMFFSGAFISITAPEFARVVLRYKEELDGRLCLKLGELMWLKADVNSIDMLVEKLNTTMFESVAFDVGRILTHIGMRNNAEQVVNVLSAQLQSGLKERRDLSLFFSGLAKTHLPGITFYLSTAIVDDWSRKWAVDALVVKAQNGRYPDFREKSLEILRKYVRYPEVQVAMAKAKLK